MNETDHIDQLINEAHDLVLAHLDTLPIPKLVPGNFISLAQFEYALTEQMIFKLFPGVDELTQTFVTALVSTAQCVQMGVNAPQELMSTQEKQKLETVLTPTEGLHVTFRTALDKLGKLTLFQRQIAERLAEIKFTH